MIEITLTQEEIGQIPNDHELGRYVRHKLFEAETHDRCGICGRISPYTRDTHINLRVGYIEGGGQGCFRGEQCPSFPETLD